MSLLEIAEVAAAGPDERLWGSSLDRPVPGTRADAGALDVAGWVLGRGAPAVAVELVQGEAVLRRAAVQLSRLDVAAAFPDVPGAGQCGFSSIVEVDRLTSGTELLIRAVMQDRSRVPLGTIRMRSSSGKLHAPRQARGWKRAIADLAGAVQHERGRIASPRRLWVSREKWGIPLVPAHKNPRGTVLVAGWFSFEHGHATAGDLLACDVTCGWLRSTGRAYQVAFAPPFRGGVDWRSVNPKDYSHVVFVCGPFQDGPLEYQFLRRFAECSLIGLDLSMALSLDLWNPFDHLFERDSSAGTRPDISFVSAQARVPVVGIVLLERTEGALNDVASAVIQRLIGAREVAAVPVDTRLDTNSTGLRSPAEIESLIARMDVVVTTRLHGMVLALKNGVPALAIESRPGAAKIRLQAETIGWPIVFDADAVTDEAVQEAFDFCLTEEARLKARECAARAAAMVENVRDGFVRAISADAMRDTTGLRTNSAGSSP